MTRTLVTNGTATVEITLDPDEGHATAACDSCRWTTEPGRFDGIADVQQEAEIHIDHRHPPTT